jgi:hypothetical protein
LVERIYAGDLDAELAVLAAAVRVHLHMSFGVRLDV